MEADETSSERTETSAQRAETSQAPMPPELRWTVGCLVAALATVGLFILVLLVAIALEPPTWMQVVLGVGLVIGGAIFAWLIASALGERHR